MPFFKSRYKKESERLMQLTNAALEAQEKEGNTSPGTGITFAASRLSNATSDHGNSPTTATVLHDEGPGSATMSQGNTSPLADHTGRVAGVNGAVAEKAGEQSDMAHLSSLAGWHWQEQEQEGLEGDEEAATTNTDALSDNDNSSCLIMPTHPSQEGSDDAESEGGEHSRASVMTDDGTVETVSWSQRPEPPTQTAEAGPDENSPVTSTPLQAKCGLIYDEEHLDRSFHEVKRGKKGKLRSPTKRSNSLRRLFTSSSSPKVQQHLADVGVQVTMAAWLDDDLDLPESLREPGGELGMEDVVRLARTLAKTNWENERALLDAEAELRDSEKSICQLRGALHEREEECEKLRHSIGYVREERDELALHNRTLNGKIASLTKSLGERQDCLESVNKKTMRTFADLDEAHQDMEGLELENEFLIEEKEDLEKTVVRLQEDNSRLKMSLHNADRRTQEYKSLYLETKLTSSETLGGYLQQMNECMEDQRLLLRQAARGKSLDIRRIMVRADNFLQMKAERNRLVDEIDLLTSQTVAQDLHIEELQKRLNDLLTINQGAASELLARAMGDNQANQQQANDTRNVQSWPSGKKHVGSMRQRMKSDGTSKMRHNQRGANACGKPQYMGDNPDDSLQQNLGDLDVQGYRGQATQPRYQPHAPPFVADSGGPVDGLQHQPRQPWTTAPNFSASHWLSPPMMNTNMPAQTYTAADGDGETMQYWSDGTDRLDVSPYWSKPGGITWSAASQPAGANNRDGFNSNVNAHTDDVPAHDSKLAEGYTAYDDVSSRPVAQSGKRHAKYVNRGVGTDDAHVADDRDLSHMSPGEVSHETSSMQYTDKEVDMTCETEHDESSAEDASEMSETDAGASTAADDEGTDCLDEAQSYSSDFSEDEQQDEEEEEEKQPQRRQERCSNSDDLAAGMSDSVAMQYAHNDVYMFDGRYHHHSRHNGGAFRGSRARARYTENTDIQAPDDLGGVNNSNNVRPECQNHAPRGDVIRSGHRHVISGCSLGDGECSAAASQRYSGSGTPTPTPSPLLTPGRHEDSSPNSSPLISNGDHLYFTAEDTPP